MRAGLNVDVQVVKEDGRRLPVRRDIRRDAEVRGDADSLAQLGSGFTLACYFGTSRRNFPSLPKGNCLAVIFLPGRRGHGVEDSHFLASIADGALTC